MYRKLKSFFIVIQTEFKVFNRYIKAHTHAQIERIIVIFIIIVDFHFGKSILFCVHKRYKEKIKMNGI